MADVIQNAGGGIVRRFIDQGDGTVAEVVALALGTPAVDLTAFTAAVSAFTAAAVALATSLGSLVVDPAGRTIAAGESGSIYSNEGASALDVFTLPPAAQGLRFSFMVEDADGIKVVAGTGDTIQVAASVSAAAGHAQNTTIGSSLTLVALNATEWMAISAVGTWTVA